MSRKIFTQVSVLFLFLLALLATPFGARAGGVCGGTWTVAQGETLDTIAATCGTSVATITAANPGIGGGLTVGQVITVPGSTGSSPSTPVPGTGATPVPSTMVNNYYTTNNYYNNVPTSSTTYNGTYIVKYGDTFSTIASRFGVSVSALWIANPYIWDINLIYVGQAIYIPGSSGTVTYPPPAPTAAQDPVHLTAGTAPKGTPNGEVRLSNRADRDVYVSLQGTTSDGTTVINEYPVSGTFSVKVPAGWYVYVAWVGGEKFVGEFKLGGDLERSLIFYGNKVVVQ